MTNMKKDELITTVEDNKKSISYLLDITRECTENIKALAEFKKEAELEMDEMQTQINNLRGNL